VYSVGDARPHPQDNDPLFEAVARLYALRARVAGAAAAAAVDGHVNGMVIATQRLKSGDADPGARN
jgi:hypothetical protein